MSTSDQKYGKSQKGKEAKARYNKRVRNRVLALLGNKCTKCGITDIRVLQVDHIKGGGHQEVKLIGSTGIYRKIINLGTEGYQLLCANCNWIKRVENKEVLNQL